MHAAIVQLLVEEDFLGKSITCAKYYQSRHLECLIIVMLEMEVFLNIPNDRRQREVRKKRTLLARLVEVRQISTTKAYKPNTETLKESYTMATECYLL